MQAQRSVSERACSAVTVSGPERGSTGKRASFSKFLLCCKPSLRPLRREFKRVGVKNPYDFLRMARLEDRYREGLLRGRMHLTELEIAEVKTVMDRIR